MPDEQLPINASTLDVQSILRELEVPFSPNQVQWRVTNTAKDRKRGQVVPCADPRAYADRLNALFTPQRNREQHYEDERWREHRHWKDSGDLHGHDHRSLVVFRHS